MGARGPLKLAPAGATEPAEETAATVVRPGKPAKPHGLPATVSKAWDQAVESLEAAGMLAECDGPTLDLALRHYAVALQAARKLQQAGTAIYDDKNKRWAKHPASQVFRDHSAMFIEYAKLLGLAYGARARLRTPESAHGDQDGNPFGAQTG